MVQVYIRIERNYKYVIERKWKYVYKHQSVKRASINIVFAMGTFIALLTCILLTPCRSLATDVPTRQHCLDSTSVPTTMSTTKGDNNGQGVSYIEAGVLMYCRLHMHRTLHRRLFPVAIEDRVHEAHGVRQYRQHAVGRERLLWLPDMVGHVIEG